MSRERSSFRLISEGIVIKLPLAYANIVLYLRERKKQTEKHAHAARFTTIAKSIVTTFGLNFFRVANATRDLTNFEIKYFNH